MVEFQAQSVIATDLDSVTYFIYFYPSNPATIVLTLASTPGYSPTGVLPVFVLSSPPNAQGHLPTRLSLISVPEYLIPALPFYPPLVPTPWLSIHIDRLSLVWETFFDKIVMVGSFSISKSSLLKILKTLGLNTIGCLIFIFKPNILLWNPHRRFWTPYNKFIYFGTR